MGPLDLLNHLLNFVAPALCVGLLVAVAARLGLRPGPRAPGFWRQVALNGVAGMAVLFGGLLWLGRDGKMATYAALVVAVASSQAWMLRGGRD